MNSKPYPVEFMTVKVLDYDNMHSGLNALKKLTNVMHSTSYRYDHSFLEFQWSSI